MKFKRILESDDFDVTMVGEYENSVVTLQKYLKVSPRILEQIRAAFLTYTDDYLVELEEGEEEDPIVGSAEVAAAAMRGIKSASTIEDLFAAIRTFGNPGEYANQVLGFIYQEYPNLPKSLITAMRLYATSNFGLL